MSINALGGFFIHLLVSCQVRVFCYELTRETSVAAAAAAAFTYVWLEGLFFRFQYSFPLEGDWLLANSPLIPHLILLSPFLFCMFVCLSEWVLTFYKLTKAMQPASQPSLNCLLHDSPLTTCTRTLLQEEEEKKRWSQPFIWRKKSPFWTVVGMHLFRVPIWHYSPLHF